MKSNVIAVALAAFLIVTVLLVLVLSHNQHLESDSNAPKLRVTDFSVDDPSVIVWGAIDWHFNVTIENYGTTNVSNVKLYVTMVNNQTNTNLWKYNATINNVLAGSQRSIHGVLITDMSSSNSWLEGHVSNLKNVVSFNVSLAVDNKLVVQKII